MLRGFGKLVGGLSGPYRLRVILKGAFSEQYGRWVGEESFSGVGRVVWGVRNWVSVISAIANYDLKLPE